jgi:hypothetical protein
MRLSYTLFWGGKMIAPHPDGDCPCTPLVQQRSGSFSLWQYSADHSGLVRRVSDGIVCPCSESSMSLASRLSDDVSHSPTSSQSRPRSKDTTTGPPQVGSVCGIHTTPGPQYPAVPAP